jgi:hypothetical protein
MNDATSSIHNQDSTVFLLARELARAEARCAALAQTRRWSLAALAVAASLGFGAGVYVTAPAVAQSQMPAGQAPHASSPAPAANRDQLLAMLPAAERARLEDFEQKVAWISQYTRSSPQFDAGAAIALFLGNMAKAMESVPLMHAEMQVMNAKMNALPFMANEVAGMNAKMGVMTADMDSTMGRAGRMMPWGW